jgi:hypothetical protein
MEWQSADDSAALTPAEEKLMAELAAIDMSQVRAAAAPAEPPPTRPAHHHLLARHPKPPNAAHTRMIAAVTCPAGLTGPAGWPRVLVG